MLLAHYDPEIQGQEECILSKNTRKSVLIPPYWLDVLFAVAVFAISQWEWLFTRSTGFQHRQQSFFLIAGIYLLIRNCVSYIVHPKGIIICWMLIPFRLIKWERVSTAEYLYQWHTWKIHQETKGQGIFITLPQAPIFSPEIDELSKFILKHPFSSCFIRFTPRNRKRYVEVFRQYYPDLQFQLGCDTSWLSADNHGE